MSSFLRRLFEHFPAMLETQEAVVFFAYAQRWDDQLVFDLIRGWRRSGYAFLQRAYGELVGLVAIAKDVADWSSAKDDIIASGTEDMRIGLAYAAVNTWSDDKLRRRSAATLGTLLTGATGKLVAAVMDVFRTVEELPPDALTFDLLRALANPRTDLSAAPSDYVVERLQALLPHGADLTATLAEKLVVAWRNELSDIGTGTAMAAQQLTDLALTLHRLGGASRKAGVALFEAMIEMDAYGARETLAEIDGRLGPYPPSTVRQRLRRRASRVQG